MPRLARLAAREIITIFEKAGFSLVRQSGSHKIYRKATGKRVTVPFHGANPTLTTGRPFRRFLATSYLQVYSFQRRFSGKGL